MNNFKKDHNSRRSRLAALILGPAIAASLLAMSPAQAEEPVPVSVPIKAGTWNLCNNACAKGEPEENLGSFDSRAARMATAIQASGVDVIGLQETASGNAASLLRYLGSNWSVSETVENITLIHNNTVWSTKSASGANLTGGYIQNTPASQTQWSKKKTPYQVLRNIKSGLEINFIDVHLHWGATGANGYSTMAEHRAEQSAAIMTAAAKIKSPIDTVILGDLNAAYDPWYGEQSVLKVYEDKGLRSVFKTATSFTPNERVSTYNGGTDYRESEYKIDHIFSSELVKMPTMHQFSDSKVTDHNLVWTDMEIGGLSNARKVPTAFKSVAADTTSLSFDWDDVADAPQYRIQLSTSSKMSSASYFRFWNSEGTIEGLKPGTTYYAKVRTIMTDGGNLSSYTSTAIKVVTPKVAAPTTSVPAGYQFNAPDGLAAVSNSAGALTFTWFENTDASKYRIQLSTSSSMSGAKYYRFSPSSGTVTGLSKGKTYYAKVRVITVDGKNLSPYSAYVKVVTK